jgi:MYXO-CTERM domain-containing protein
MQPALDVGHVVDNGAVHDVFDQVDATGTGWVRINFRYGDLAAYDQVVDEYLSRGIEVYGLINDEAVDSTLDENSDAWRAVFVQTAQMLIAHFENRVRVFEIINEPNDYAGGTSARFTAIAFAKIMQDTYTAVKRGDACSDVTLVSGPLFSFDGNDSAAYLQQVIDAWGGASYMDGIGYHMYVAQGLDSTTADVGTSMAANLGAIEAVSSKPIWVSEYGWRADVVGDDEQAARMQAGFDAMKQDGHVQLATYFTLKDFPGNDWGVYTAADVRRPSADRLASIAAANLPARSARVVSVTADANEAVVTLQNRGSETWSNGIRLGAAAGCPDAALTNAIAWAPASGYANSVTDARVYLDHDVAPGDMIEIHVPLSAMPAGTYTFAARMVEDGVAWFGPTVTAQITVADTSGGDVTAPRAATGCGCTSGGGAGDAALPLVIGALCLRRRRVR